MPLAWFLDDGGERLEFDAAIRAALDRPSQYTAPILQGMVASGARRENVGVSASTLGGCERQAFFNETEDYGQHPSKLYPALRGTMIHSILEGHPNEEIWAEHRFGRRTLSGVWVTGKFDHLEYRSGRLYDYKSKEKAPAVVPYNYAAQLNTYRWIMQAPCDPATGEVLNPVEVREIFLTYLTTKGVVGPVAVRLWADGEWERRLEPVALRIRRAIEGGEWPQRISPHPQLETLCTEWCPHFQRCLERD